MIDTNTMERCKSAANTYSDIYVKQGSEPFCQQWKEDVENEVYSFAEQFIILRLTDWYIEVKLIPAECQAKIAKARQALSELQKAFFEITSIEELEEW